MATRQDNLSDPLTTTKTDPEIGETNVFLFDNDDSIEVDTIHPLLDIPIMDTYEEFITALENHNAPQTFTNEYDGVEILCFKAEQAISDIRCLSDLERQSIQYTTETIQNTNEFTSYQDFTTSWFETFLDRYNELLAARTPEDFSAFRKQAIELADEPGLTSKLLVETIADDLNLNVSIEE